MAGFLDMNDLDWMQIALVEARRGGEAGEVPVGALVVEGERLLAKAHNLREQQGNPVAHAEVLALERAARQRSGWRLDGCTLYVTLEPCAMCAGALVNSRIERLVYGAPDPKAGYCGSLGNLVTDERLNHRLTVTAGVLEEQCGAILRDFFRRLRQEG